MSETLRVWVGCLACYNGGALIGEWCDADTAGDVTTEFIHRDIKGAASPDRWRAHEELWCFDTEGFNGLHTGEMSPAEAQRIAELAASVDDPQALGAYRELIGGTLDDGTVSSFEDAFCGEWESEKDYAQNHADETVEGLADAKWPMNCIDWDHATRELFFDYSSMPAGNGNVYVFRNQ